MELKQTISLVEHSQTFAVITHATPQIQRLISGYRLSFHFRVSTFKPKDSETLDSIGCEADVYVGAGSGSLLLGRLSPAVGDRLIFLNGHESHIRRSIDLSAETFMLLMDVSYGSDVSFEFEAAPTFVGGYRYPSTSRGRLEIPHSEWLKLLNGLELERFELIALRIPISASHQKSPFQDALVKIHQAEKLYAQGKWNAAAAAGRDAWRTILSDAGDKKGFEHLIARVVGDPQRKQFASQLIKALNDILNRGVHLEGDVKTQTPPGDLEPEDALLCLQLYTVIIGYVSSVYEPADE